MVFYGRVSKRAVFSVKLAIDLWVDLEAENKVCGVTSRLLRLGLVLLSKTILRQ